MLPPTPLLRAHPPYRRPHALGPRRRPLAGPLPPSDLVVDPFPVRIEGGAGRRTPWSPRGTLGVRMRVSDFSSKAVGGGGDPASHPLRNFRVTDLGVPSCIAWRRPIVRPRPSEGGATRRPEGVFACRTAPCGFPALRVRDQGHGPDGRSEAWRFSRSGGLREDPVRCTRVRGLHPAGTGTVLRSAPAHVAWRERSSVPYGLAAPGTNPEGAESMRRAEVSVL